jgi:hypothetical protein
MMNTAGWNDISMESSSKIYQGTQREKKQVRDGGMERSNQQESRYFKLQISLFLNSELWGLFVFMKGQKTRVYDTI